jgi:hypothetical protein
VAAADAPPPSAPADTAVDVVVHDALPPQRVLAIEFNPLSLIIGKISANAIITPGDHWALMLSPFYVSTTTQSIVIFGNAPSGLQGPSPSPTALLPQQTFSGFGGEIGGRYYTGLGGPRGFFGGASLILGAMNAHAQDGSNLGYLDYGVAVDLGYEVLVVDKVALTVGAGVQWTNPSTPVPNQQFPADVYANGKVMPRMLASIGWAF